MASEREQNCCCCVGPQGVQGPAGMMGPQGPAGATGPRGANGATGAQGVQGAQGQNGLNGPAGAQGPAGAIGAQGAQGVAGAQGPKGADGAPGAAGPAGAQGANGPMGPQGPQGLQGVPGKDCNPDCCKKVYLNLYSIKDQSLGPNGSATDAVKLELTGQITLPDFDISLAATTGAVKFLKAGVYQLAWDACGQLAPPFPSPVPSWALGMYINGVLVPSSTTAGFSQSPDDDATSLAMVFNVKINVGDVMQIRSVATSPIFLKAIHPELVAPTVSGSFSALLIA